jgi:ABC-type lipoprotein export system ATPase subunit
MKQYEIKTRNEKFQFQRSGGKQRRVARRRAAGEAWSF